MDVERYLEDFVLGSIQADDLWKFGVQALVDGLDSPSLRRLAGSEREDGQTQLALFHRSLGELGVGIPTPVEAGLARARRTALSVLRGETPPYQGAKQIWREVYEKFTDLDVLAGFKAYASEYEDDVKHQDEYAAAIVDECRELLASDGPRPPLEERAENPEDGKAATSAPPGLPPPLPHPHEQPPEARPEPPRTDMDHEIRVLVVYTLCAAAVVVAGLILKYERSYMLGSIALQTGWPGARGFVAIAIIATVFGVGAMRRPIASLIGAVLATMLFNEGRSSEPVDPSLLPPFIWISWLQGRLAYWFARFPRFVRRLITRPGQPSPDNAAKPDAAAPNERAQMDEATPNTGATA